MKPAEGLPQRFGQGNVADALSREWALAVREVERLKGFAVFDPQLLSDIQGPTEARTGLEPFLGQADCRFQRAGPGQSENC